MNALENSRRVWQALARSDPYWAVCTDPRKKDGKWNAPELLATGVFEVETVLSFVRGLGLSIRCNGKALDFGCGVGRLTQALSRYFAECYGVDISSEMVSTAIALAKDNPNCRFLVNEVPDLSRFESNSFSFIYSSIVLQHIESDYVTKYLREFARVLEPGGILVFQIPDHRKGEWIKRMREHLKLRTRLRRLLAFVGGPEGLPCSGWGMHCYGEQKIRHLLASGSCKVVSVRITNSCAPDFNGNLRFFDEEPTSGFVSKLYVIVKSTDRQEEG